MNNIHPIAQAVQSQGRGKDTQLVHMTPNEVQGLHALAKAHGGSLSVNPETGLVEAGFLDSILPVVAGAGLMMVPGMQPMGAAMITGLGATMLNGGDLGKGLMAGMGAYGGAGLAGSLGVGAAAPSTGITAATAPVGNSATAAANAGANAAGSSAVLPSGGYGFGSNAASGINSGLATNSAGMGMQLPTVAPTTAMPTATNQFALSAKPTMADKLSSGSFYSDNAMNIGLAAAPALLAADQPKGSSYVPDDEQYQYDYNPNKTSQAGLDAQRLANPGGELNYFNSTFSDPRRVRINAAQGGLLGLAEGGSLAEGGMSFDYTYDPATQTYIKKPGAAAAPMAAPMGAVAPIGIVGGAGSSSGDKPIVPSKEYKGPGLLSMLLGDFGREGPNAPVVDMSTPYSFEAPVQGVPAPVVDSGGGSRSVGGGGGGFDGGGADGGIGGGGGVDGGGFDGGASMAKGGLMGLAAGGMARGGFVVPADVVSALGNGSTDAGLRSLKSKFGAVKHIKGKGDGLSDSINTSIDGRQRARVADGEAYIDPKTVASIGKGDPKKGAQKLYAMMDKIRSQAHGKTTQQRKVDPRKVV